VVFSDRDEPEKCIGLLKAGTLKRVKGDQCPQWRVLGRLVDGLAVKMSLERRRELAEVVDERDDFCYVTCGCSGGGGGTLGGEILDALGHVLLMFR
jgi:hypothetical protein